MTGQMYVERLTPSEVKHKHPLIFIHGLAQTAAVRLPRPLSPSLHLTERNTQLTSLPCSELAKYARRPRGLGFLLSLSRLRRLLVGPASTWTLSLAARRWGACRPLSCWRSFPLHRSRDFRSSPISTSEAAYPMAWDWTTWRSGL